MLPLIGRRKKRKKSRNMTKNPSFRNIYREESPPHTDIISEQIVVVDRYEDYKIYLPTINISIDWIVVGEWMRVFVCDMEHSDRQIKWRIQVKQQSIAENYSTLFGNVVRMCVRGLVFSRLHSFLLCRWVEA